MQLASRTLKGARESLLAVCGSAHACSRLLHSSVAQHYAAAESAAAAEVPGPSSTQGEQGEASSSTSSSSEPLNLKELSRSIRRNTRLQVHGDLSFEVGIAAEMQRRQDHYLELLLAKARLASKEQPGLATSLLEALREEAQQQQQQQQQQEEQQQGRQQQGQEQQRQQGVAAAGGAGSGPRQGDRPQRPKPSAR